MKIHVWNAFASNNSGSYTIVGSFPNCQQAEDAAKELAELMRRHTEWLESQDNQGTMHAKELSPLSEFIRLHGLRTSPDDYGGWPEYGDDNSPMAFAIDSKVIIHHDYTVTLPREFGEYFYAKGGRVEQELNHAHNPIVAVCELWIPWQQSKQLDIPEKISDFLEALCVPGGSFLKHSSTGKYRPAWRSGDGLSNPQLTLGAIFDDLLLGFTSVNQVAKEHGFQTMVKVFEAFDQSDPLAFLRASTPSIKRGQRTVTLEAKGHAPAEVIKVLEQLLQIDHSEARLIIDSAPVVILFDVFPEEADDAATRMRKAGASVAIT